MHLCCKLVWFLVITLHTKLIVHKLHPISPIFVLATKQTLFSIEHWLIMLCLDPFQIVRFTGPEGHTLDTSR